LVAPLQQVALQARDVVEVAGPSGSAKSELLLQVKVELKSFSEFCFVLFVCSAFFWSSTIPHLTIVENCELVSLFIFALGTCDVWIQRTHLLDVGLDGCGLRLVKAAVTCLLPERLYGGWEGGVLWYDLDGHFDLLRLVCLLQARIHQGKALSCDMDGARV
jgi:hypothetical protein